MKISRKSWHYRLYRYIANIPRGPRFLNPFADVKRSEVDVPRSICPYSWAILLGVIGIAVLAVLGLAVAPFYLAFLVLSALVKVARRVDAAFASAMPRINLERKPRQRKERKSLLLAVLRAKKDRVCPTIKLVD